MRSAEARTTRGEWGSFWSGVARRAASALVATTIALTCAACGDDEPKDDEHPDRGDITTSFGAAPDLVSSELAVSFEETELFEDIARALNETLKFPVDLPVAHVACGEANAFYDPTKQQLSMCYELLTAIAQVAYDPSVSDVEVAERIVGTWMFVFFHELGHGLIDLYELPVTGREEDAVDDFSTLLLIDMGLTSYAIRAAEYWAATDQGVTSPSVFADEHSLNAQRFYAILCLVYGSDPDEYEGLVTGGFLPEDRAVRCPSEWRSKRAAWDQLLEPWEK